MIHQVASQKVYPIDNINSPYFDNLALKTKVTLGRCPICGNVTLFKWALSNYRETGKCYFCRDTNRKRQVGSIFLYSVYKSTGVKFSSVKTLAQKVSLLDQFTDFTIYNTETYGSIHEYLRDYPGYISSEYLDKSYQSGETINGVCHQDLTNTSFDDDSVNVLISSDCFEHIPDPYRAFEEVYRILKPGGRHVFTVPFYQDQYFDETRAYIDENGQLQHLLSPIYHSDPLRKEGILVYVIFSLEMLLKLRKIGYEVSMYNLRNPWFGILGNNALVFETIKPMEI
ncbi:MAG: class I SAM-dependent methyltransferase [Aphanocapsa sp. GSE-SYN-MK-11-07L]|jgi:SAM-dependent methyltransferase|nr:class I SAM-dependent methyltransferase [Aphanocapsa sp. GSE-SYN-MK-11-07L]